MCWIIVPAIASAFEFNCDWIFELQFAKYPNVVGVILFKSVVKTTSSKTILLVIFLWGVGSSLYEISVVRCAKSFTVVVSVATFTFVVSVFVFKELSF